MGVVFPRASFNPQAKWSVLIPKISSVCHVCLLQSSEIFLSEVLMFLLLRKTSVAREGRKNNTVFSH